ncbi:MAG TPA: hypothetical protein VGD23_01590 [Sphingomicrobium sp.]
MVASVRIVDEHFGASAPERLPACELQLVSERVTPREIIRRRVEAEVEALNRTKIEHAQGHSRTRSFLVGVEEGSAEARLNRALPIGRKPKLLDADHEARRAQEAFDKHSFIMLFDDRQIDDPDQEVTLMPDSEIAFIYLSPLKGG